jgi:AcrR family transcriptional regulator
MKDSVQPKTTREAILDATDRLLAWYGYKKMTIDDLAREVGIGKGSIYLHFTSKEEIALTHIDRIIDRLKKRLSIIAKDSTACDERIRHMLVERVIFRFDSVQHYTQNLNDMLARLRPKLLERRKKYFEEEAEIFARVLDEGQCKNDFAGGDAMETARTLLVATNSLLPYSLSTQELGKRADIEKKTLAIADVLLEGLKRRSDPPA